MLALFVILLNVVVLMWQSVLVDNEFLRYTAWLLSTIFLVSFMQALVHRGKK